MRAAFPIFVFLACLPLLAGPAPAEGAAIAEIRHDLERIGSELHEGRIQLAQAGESARTAALQAQLLRLEEELRTLTGRLERVEFDQRQTGNRIDRLVADVDDRLRRLENQISGSADAGDAAQDRSDLGGLDRLESTPSGADGETAPGGADVSGADVEADSATGERATGEAAAGEGYVLGTIPRDALLGIDRPAEQVGDAEGAAAEVPEAALEGSASERFAAALSLLQDGNWGAAETAFSRFVDDFPEAEQTPSAAFWIGESHFFRENYAEAAAEFASNYRTYGADAPRAPDNLLKLGMSLARMDDAERACQTFAELDRRYPNAAAPIRQALARERDDAGCG